MDKENTFQSYASENDRINVLLENFTFFHRPSTEEQIDPKYRPPVNAFHQFTNWLKENEAKSAIYLITGYRGAGKSSFVNYVIRNLNRPKEKKFFQRKRQYIPISINMGQENLKEIELLRLIARKLFADLQKRWIVGLSVLTSVMSFLSLLCYFLFFILILKLSYVNAYIIAVPYSLFILCGLLLNIAGWAIKTHTRLNIYHRLKKLCRRLNSSLIDETEVTISGKIDSVIGAWKNAKKQSWSSPPATIQEIEYELISLLDRLRNTYKRRRYIIIFDELDKVNPTTVEAEPRELQPEYKNLSSPQRLVSSRERKQQILALISNMKYFLSTASAYFVFIAGREMYEAFQADMSDRDFSLNSIFSGVLNIDSFLSSPRTINDTAMKTEQYVCRQLLPENFYTKIEHDRHYDFKRKYSLKNYYLYHIQNRTDYIEGETYEQFCQRIWREALFLYHFVSYLSFICNGSPKKLSLFFEKYIRSRAYLQKKENVKFPKGERLSDRNPEEVFYLSFGYYSQLKINFVHYLTYPIIQNMVNRANMYGDKLLVASSFLITHIFKLHNNGFSWRNIEQMPEVQDINKTPEIREYIGSILDFMGHSYLTIIPYGLYHYKFPMSISEEITFQSKLSGEMSALFNFSPEEMKNVKKHYAELLHRRESNDENDFGSQYTSASTHHSLGDIYMMEENYSAAIREYELAIEMLDKYDKGAKDDKNHLLFQNRTRLKLGLAHEKRRTDNSAFVVYSELIDLLKKCNKENKDSAQLLFQNVRTMHLSLLARLYVLEKLDTNGITLEHIRAVCNMFRYLFYNSGALIKADFYRKLGDILYYKNQTFEYLFDVAFPGGICNAKKCYLISLDALLSLNLTAEDNNLCQEIYQKVYKERSKLIEKTNSDDISRDYVIHHIALGCESMGHISLYDYDESNWKVDIRSLYNIVDTFIEDKIPIAKPKNYLIRALFYYKAAAYMYNLSCERGLSVKCHKEMLYTLVIYFRHLSEDKLKDDEVEKIIGLLDYIAKRAMVSIYRQKEHIYQSEENVLKWIQSKEMFEEVQYSDVSASPESEEVFYKYYTALLELYKEYPENTLLQKKLKDFYRSPIMTGKQPCQTLNTMIINLKLKAQFNTCFLSQIFKCDNLCEIKFKQIDTYMNGAMNGFAVDVFFPEYGNNKTKDELQERRKDLLEFLVADSLFCLTRIAEVLTPMRDTTLFNNSFKANIYYTLLQNSTLYKRLYCFYTYGDEAYTDFLIDKSLDDKVTELSGTPTNNPNLERRDAFFKRVAYLTRKSTPSNTYIPYLAERSIYFYTRARQMHTQGRTYQEVMRNLHFLNSDLTNDTMQFYLAAERLYWKTGEMGNREKTLKETYKDVSTYNIGNYYVETTSSD